MRYSSINRPRRRKILTAIGVAALVLVLLIVAISIFSAPTRVRSARGRMRSMPFTADNFVPFADGAVYTTDDGKLYHISETGTLNWGFDNAVDTMKLTAGPSLLTCYGGNKLQIISKSGQLIASPTFEGEIVDVRSSASLVCASVHLTDNSTYLAVLSSGGENLASLTLLSGQQLVNFGISEGGAEVWMLSVEESARPVYQVDIHSFSSGEHKLTASIPVEDEAVYAVELNRKGLFLTGTQSLRTYNSTNQLTEQQNIYGRQLIASAGTVNSCIHIFANQSRPYSALDVSTGGGAPRTILLNTAAGCVLTKNNKIYAFTGNRMLVYSLQGKLQATYDLPHPVERVRQGYGRNSVYLIFQNTVTLMKLP